MLRRRRHGRGGETARATIDMNSLIDLTFLLLVTFMLTIPALEQGVSIILPQAKTDVLPNKENKAHIITIDAENHVYFKRPKQKDQPVSLDELEATLKKLVAEDPDIPVLVRGDQRLTYGSVMDVVKIVHKTKVRRMALVTVDK